MKVKTFPYKPRIQKKTALLYLAQIIIAMAFLYLTVYAAKNPRIYSIDYGTGNTDCVNYNGTELSVKDGLDTGGGSLSFDIGNFTALPAGSYTMVVNYDADLQQQLFLSSSSSWFITKVIYLSSNKTSGTYDFYASKDLEDLRCTILGYSQGELRISNLQIVSNNHNYRLMLFIWLLICILTDVCLNSHWIKERKSLLLYLLAISLFPSLLLAVTGIGYGQDIKFHLLRIEGIAEGIRSGQFPVRMYESFIDEYGYPAGIFYGDALLYIPACLRVIGFTVSAAYKIYIFIINVLTTFVGYWCFRRMMSGKMALIAVLAYVTASYRLVDIYVRGAVGEYTSFLFFPIIFLAVWNIYSGEMTDKESIKSSILLACGMAGLLYTHVLSTEMTVVVLLIVAVIFWKRTFCRKTLKALVRAVLLFLPIGAGFIVPFLDYYLHTETNIAGNGEEGAMQIQSVGASVADYFSVFRNCDGLTSDYIKDRMQLTPGFLLMLVLIGAVYLIIRGYASKRMKALTLLSGILLFMASNLFPWDVLEKYTKIGKFLVQIQFPWRYLSFAVLVLTVLLSLVSQELVKNHIVSEHIYVFETILAIGCCCLFISSYVDTRQDYYYYCDTAEIPQYISDGKLLNDDYLLVNTDSTQLSYGVECTDAEAIILSEDGQDMVLKVMAGDNASIEIPRFNYPNYTVQDDQEMSYELLAGSNNRIKIVFPDGYTGLLYVRYVEPWYWRLSEIISFVSIVLILMLFVRRKQFLQGMH